MNPTFPKDMNKASQIIKSDAAPPLELDDGWGSDLFLPAGPPPQVMVLLAQVQAGVLLALAIRRGSSVVCGTISVTLDIVTRVSIGPILINSGVDNYLLRTLRRCE